MREMEGAELATGARSCAAGQRRLLRAGLIVVCCAAALAAVMRLHPGQSALAENTEGRGAESAGWHLPGASSNDRDKVRYKHLDGKINQILQAEHTAAGAIGVLSQETNMLPMARGFTPAARDEREGALAASLIPSSATSGHKNDWTDNMQEKLERLNEMQLVEAEQIAPSNLELHPSKIHSAPEAAAHKPAAESRHLAAASRVAHAIAASAAGAANTAAGPDGTTERDASTAVTIRAAAAARVAQALGGSSQKNAVSQQLAVAAEGVKKVRPNTKNPTARSHLQARTMMLTAGAPTATMEQADAGEAEEHGNDGAQVADTVMAIEDAMSDTGMGEEAKLGDTLEGRWHAPMWPGNSDEGSPVLTSTIAAPGQGGEYAYGFPYDEAKLFSLDAGQNATDTNVTSEEADEDVVAAADDEDGAQAAHSSQGFYQGVGAGGSEGPGGGGGWGNKALPPRVPGEVQRETWLRTRGSGFTDEFYGAAKRLARKSRAHGLDGDAVYSTRQSGEGAGGKSARMASMRNKIAKFVGAFDVAAGRESVQTKDGSKAEAALLGGKGTRESLVQSKTEGKAANAGAKDRGRLSPEATLYRWEESHGVDDRSKGFLAVEKKEAAAAAAVAAKKLAASKLKQVSDKEFLARFKPETVDNDEDYPCGWPGPPCSDPKGDEDAAAAGAFFRRGGTHRAQGAYWGFQAQSVPAQL